MRLAFLRKLAGRADALRYRLLSAADEERAHVERVLGLSLWVPPTVLGVREFRAGALLAREVGRLSRGKRVLDMGSGSGVAGVLAAKGGAAVTAIDINPIAVRATLVSAMLNGVVVDARCGDLFAPLGADERFDVVAFNPPFFGTALEPSHPLAIALSDAPGLPILDRFCAGVRAHLADGGVVLVAGSTNGALGTMREIFAAHRFRWRTVRARERMSERLVIDCLSES